MDEKAKKQALLMIPYGLFVLGAAHGGKATAATVNWVTQASFNPPLVVVGIKKDSGSHAMVKDSKKFALSMLAAGQKPIAGAFFRHVEPKDGKLVTSRSRTAPTAHRSSATRPRRSNATSSASTSSAITASSSAKSRTRTSSATPKRSR